MSTTGAMDPDSIALLMGMVSMLGGLLFMAALGAVIAWLIARAVKVIPPEVRRIGPSIVWGLYFAWVLLAAVLVAFTFFAYDPNADEESVLLFPIVQIPVQVFGMVATCWVMFGVPASFTAAFAAHPDSGASGGDHGRLIGLSIAMISVVTGVATSIGNLIMGQANPLREVKRSMAMQQAMYSPFDVPVGQMVMGCGMSILGIVLIVLLVIFLVRISKSRGALVRLQRGALVRLQDDLRTPPTSAPPTA